MRQCASGHWAVFPIEVCAFLTPSCLCKVETILLLCSRKSCEGQYWWLLLPRDGIQFIAALQISPYVGQVHRKLASHPAEDLQIPGDLLARAARWFYLIHWASLSCARCHYLSVSFQLWGVSEDKILCLECHVWSARGTYVLVSLWSEKLTVNLVLYSGVWHTSEVKESKTIL